MKTCSTLTIEFDQALNLKSPGTLNFFLHPANGGVRIDLDSGNLGEPANILWLAWMQVELHTWLPGSISTVDILLFTFY
ncbi:BLF1 family deaminating toxin, partial [Burkholderia pseudomallei]